MPEDRDLLLNRIGLRVTRRRQELGLTQEALAVKIGMLRAYVSRIEGGHQNLTVDTLCKLANALEISVQDLMF